MLVRYEGSALTTLRPGAVDNAFAGFRAGATPAYIREISLFTKTAPGSINDIGLKRSTALGTGTLTGNFGVSPADPQAALSLGRVMTNWGTAKPTFQTGTSRTLRRWTNTGAVIDAGIVWRWPEGNGLLVPANPAVNSELVLVQMDSNNVNTFALVIVFEE